MKAIAKNVTIHNHNEVLVNFAHSIDFSELFEHVKVFAGVNCSFYQPEITTRCGNVFVSFMSDDITNQTGPFAAILERCYLHSSGNGVFRDKETDEISYWVSVNIRYEHKDGGSNGMDMVRAWYSAGDGWVFKDVGNH